MVVCTSSRKGGRRNSQQNLRQGRWRQGRKHKRVARGEREKIMEITFVGLFYRRRGFGASTKVLFVKRDRADFSVPSGAPQHFF